MANKTISDLTPIAALAGTEVFELEDSGGDTYSCTASQLAGLPQYDTQSADYDVSSAYSNYIGAVTAGSVADVTATLPDATTVEGYAFRIMKIDTGTKNVVVDTDGGTINGQSSVDLVTQYDYLYVISNGTNYLVLDFNISYDSGWTANSDWTDLDVTFSHNMNVGISKLRYRFLISDDGTDAGLVEPVNGTSSAGGPYGLNYYGVDDDNVKVQTASAGLYYITDAAGQAVIGTQSWYYKFVVQRVKI